MVTPEDPLSLENPSTWHEEDAAERERPSRGTAPLRLWELLAAVVAFSVGVPPFVNGADQLVEMPDLRFGVILMGGSATLSLATALRDGGLHHRCRLRSSGRWSLCSGAIAVLGTMLDPTSYTVCSLMALAALVAPITAIHQVMNSAPGGTFWRWLPVLLLTPASATFLTMVATAVL